MSRPAYTPPSAADAAFVSPTPLAPFSASVSATTPLHSRHSQTAFARTRRQPANTNRSSSSSPSSPCPPRRLTVIAGADFYELLGVSRSASDQEIKSAFRQKARKLHPDVNSAPDAKERFQEVSRAYEVLSDAQTRARYDQFGEAGVGSSAASAGGGFSDFAGQDFGSFSDIFETFFGGQGGPQGRESRSRRRSGPQPGDDLRLDVDVSFETAVFGAEQKIRFSHLETCTTCSGSGMKPGTRPRTCTTCNGTGSVTQVVSTPLGMFQQTSTCQTCRGSGEIVDEYCVDCGGRGRNQVTKQLMITVPSGVDTGSRLRIRDEGDAGPKGGPPGDLYVMLRVKDSSDFTRDGINIYSTVKVSYLDAILGRAISVKTVDGPEKLTVPSGTQPGAVIKLSRKGVPKLGNSSVRGDHFVTVEVRIPTRLSADERQLVQELDDLAGGLSSQEGNGKATSATGGAPDKGRKSGKPRGDGFFNFGKK